MTTDQQALELAQMRLAASEKRADYLEKELKVQQKRVLKLVRMMGKRSKKKN